MAQRAEIAPLLAGRRLERYEAELKGIQGIRRLVRVGG